MILPISGINNNNYYRGQSFKGSALLSNNTASAYKKLDVNSADYIKYIYNRVKNWCKEVVEINVETGRLQKIVQSDEPYIFIMNHTTTQGRDINAAKFFNTLLYREYIYHSKAETCPRSKILANTGVLKKAKDGGKELEWMGVVPVYAGLADKDKQFKNASVIKNLAKQIIDGKTNLFIFPEGALAALTFLPMKYKFQPGVSAIIKKVLEVRDKIKVIPLGFAILFVAVCGLNSFHIVPEPVRLFLIEFDVFLLTMAMFALGVETNFNKIKGLGWKPIMLAGLMFLWLVFGGMAVNKVLYLL